jgi:hypothetical protein
MKVLGTKNENLGMKIRDIYTGSEQIEFTDRHPIYKALMKIEFEDVLRSYYKTISKRNHES